MDRTKKIIEGALFISGRWMGPDDLSRVACNGSVGAVKEALKELKDEYDQRGGGVILNEVNGRFRLEISPDIRDRVYYLAPEPELSPALIKTLALIAYKQPISQSKVVKVVGNRAYDYIKELRKKEFITIKKKGRSKILSTTGRFRKYFAIPEGAKWEPELGSRVLEEKQRRLDELPKGPEDETPTVEEQEVEVQEQDKNGALVKEADINKEDGIAETEEAP